MSTGQLLVVTTRSKLRGVRFLPSMLNATLSIRRQLAAADGVVRWASIIAGPTEFWTISVWESRYRMQQFMRSDAHGRWMWEFSSWLSSFWLMRWHPDRREVGRWDGIALTERRQPDRGPGPDAPPEVLDTMRREIPALYEALDAEGVARYEHSADSRRARRYVAGAGGAVVRIRCSPLRLPGVLRELRQLRRDLRGDDRLVGCAVGVGRRDEAFLLAVWRDRRCARDLLDGGWVAAARDRFGQRLWASDWRPESEFGHWDGRRLRRDRGLRVTADDEGR